MQNLIFFKLAQLLIGDYTDSDPRPTQKSPSGGSKKDKDLKKRQKSDFIDSINFNVASDPKIWSVTCPSIVESFQK